MRDVQQTASEDTANGADGPARGLTPDEFRAVIGHFASGVTVITTVDGGQPHGTTASAVSSLSLEPPMLLICMNRSSTTGQAIASSGVFAVNVLAEHQTSLAGHFATKGADKFQGTSVTSGACGQPLLDEALAHLECRVSETVPAGTHMVFLATVETATARSGKPLTYFRGQFGALEAAPDEELTGTLRRWFTTREDLWGQMLDLAEIAVDFQTTPGALYLSLGALATEGVVQPARGGGFLVTPVTAEVVEHALRARCAIDLGVAEMTVGKVSAEQLASLREAMERTLELIDGDHFRGPFGAYPAANDRFHEIMIDFAGSPQLTRAYRRLAVADVFRGTNRIPRRGPEVAALNPDHEELVAAYEAGDLERARHVIKRHTDHLVDVVRMATDTPPEP